MSLMTRATLRLGRDRDHQGLSKTTEYPKSIEYTSLTGAVMASSQNHDTNILKFQQMYIYLMQELIVMLALICKRKIHSAEKIVEHFYT